MVSVFLFIYEERYNQAVEKTLTTLEELTQEAEHLVDTLAPGSSAATLITLSGELGAGKTTFTQALARKLGVEDAVTSPTFVLEKIYELPNNQPFKKLIHIDAYRLKQGSELHALGFFGLMEDATNLIVLEWPERVESKLPPVTISITLVPNADGSRTLTYG